MKQSKKNRAIFSPVHFFSATSDDVTECDAAITKESYNAELS